MKEKTKWIDRKREEGREGRRKEFLWEEKG